MEFMILKFVTFLRTLQVLYYELTNKSQWVWQP